MRQVASNIGMVLGLVNGLRERRWHLQISVGDGSKIVLRHEYIPVVQIWVLIAMIELVSHYIRTICKSDRICVADTKRRCNKAGF